MDNSPRKTWITPQIFVLGAEGTQAYGAFTQVEGQKHFSTDVPTYGIKASDVLAQGYQS